MADNTELDAGSGGDTIATDDIAGIKHQRIKIQYGTDGSATDVSDSNPLPIDDAGGALTVDNAGSFATQATLQTGSNAIGKLAANSGVDIGDVDVLSIAAGDNNIGNVDIASALPTGSNAIGKLAANSGVDIGDVDVTSVPRSISGDGEPGTAVDSYAHVAINLTTGADQVLVSGAANKQIWVYGYGFTCGDADGQTVSLQDEDNAALTGIMEFAQYGGISVPPSGNFSMPIFKLGTDKDLEIDITSGDVDGWLVYAILSV